MVNYQILCHTNFPFGDAASVWGTRLNSAHLKWLQTLQLFRGDSAQRYLAEMYMLGKLRFPSFFGPAVFAGHVRPCKYSLGSGPAGTGLSYTHCAYFICVSFFYIFVYLKESALGTSDPGLPLHRHTSSCYFLFHKENWLLATPAHTLALIASPTSGA